MTYLQNISNTLTYKTIFVHLHTLNNLEFTEEDLEKMDIALQMLEEIFEGKVIDIAPKKKDIEKITSLGVHTDDLDEIEATPAFINMGQWVKDEAIRNILGPRAVRLENIAAKIINTNRAILKRCWSSSNTYLDLNQSF